MKNIFKTIDKYLGVVAKIAMITSYIPQLVLTYSTRNVSGQSFTFWTLLLVGLVITAYKAVRAYLANKTNDTLTVVWFAVPNVLLALAMWVAVIIFK
jgi:hypothetical protein